MTYTEIASDWVLWCEQIDPCAVMTRAEFDGLSIAVKVALITACCGPESDKGEE